MKFKILKMQYFSASVKLKVILCLFFLVTAYAGKAQSYGEIGIYGGGAYYIGDLNPNKHFQLVKPSFGAFIRHNFNERFAVKLQGTYGQLEGSDEASGYDPSRNLYFLSNITDISATFEVNMYPYFIGSLRHYFTPYMFGGVGISMFNPKARFDGNFYELRPLLTEGQSKMYSKNSMNIPFGIGVKYSINDFIGLTVNWSMHKTFTDYIDDVSTTYYLIAPDGTDVTQYLSDPTLNHTPGMQRGNSQNNDWYSFVGAALSLKINYRSSTKCLNTFL